MGGPCGWPDPGHEIFWQFVIGHGPTTYHHASEHVQFHICVGGQCQVLLQIIKQRLGLSRLVDPTCDCSEDPTRDIYRYLYYL